MPANALEFFLSRTTTVDDPAPELPPHLVRMAEVLLERVDTEDMMIDEDEVFEIVMSFAPDKPAPKRSRQPVNDPDKLALEPIYTIIDYGEPLERRRITLKTLQRGPNAPLVRAICHERNALRCFRADRIDGFIEDDGEVLTPATFFQTYVGIDLADWQPDQSKEERSLVTTLRNRLRPALTVLAAAARSDGRFCLDEMDVIERYIESDMLAFAESNPDRQVSLDIAEQIGAILPRLNPERASVLKALERVFDYSTERYRRFAATLERVIMADGVLHDEEVSFVGEITRARERWLTSVRYD